MNPTTLGLSGNFMGFGSHAVLLTRLVFDMLRILFQNAANHLTASKSAFS
ncbi:hypothetical protein [Hymenobacter sedentarius]|nr:hypothetical protein [Hymenobacter sedentarius]